MKFVVVDGIKKYLRLLTAFLFLASFAIGCTSTTNNTNNLYFPVQKEPQTKFMLALLYGKLVEDSGYLRVEQNLIIWPYGYSLLTDKNEIFILNEKGREVARVGDSIRLGGVNIPASFAEEKIGQKLPAGVEGPFWEANPIETIS